MQTQTNEENDKNRTKSPKAFTPGEVNWLLIDEHQAGQSVGNFLASLARDVPKNHFYRIIRSGEVRVNKGRCQPDTKLQVGDVVRVPPLKSQKKQVPLEAAPRLQSHQIQVLYEDRDLLVLDKPAGIASHGGSGIQFGLIERLRASRPDCPFLELAHRLDKETSGAIIVAKTRKALVRLQTMMKDGGLEKHYRALVVGDWVNDRQHVKAPLHRYTLPSGERRVEVNKTLGVSAHSIFTKLERFGPATYVDVELKTGRTHQIRVHALSEGHPLVGDDKYGDYALNREVAAGLWGRPFKRMFLHAYSLRFEHPVTHEMLDIVAPLPEACVAVLEDLRA